MDTFSIHKGYAVPGVVAGKPIALRGSQGREEATGRGCVYTILSALKVNGVESTDLDVAIQGFGNVGSNAAKILHDLGFKIVVLSDVSGGLYNKKGIDPYDLQKYHKENGVLAGYKKASSMPGEEIFGADCDILIPVALENQIKRSNADSVKAKFIAEAANAPVTPIADEILNSNGKFLIPDILCNAGGVTVSYFEWVQGNDAYFWSRRRVNLSLRDIMEKAFYSVYKISKDRKVNMRKVANILGIGTVAEAVRLRGIYP